MSAVEAPVVEIERLVQDRAKELALALDSAEGEAVLRHLIDEEVERWADDHRRGVRAALVRPDAVAARAFNDIARYGPLTDLLEDDDVWEVMINSPADIFVKRQQGAVAIEEAGSMQTTSLLEHFLRTT